MVVACSNFGSFPTRGEVSHRGGENRIMVISDGPLLKDVLSSSMSHGATRLLRLFMEKPSSLCVVHVHGKKQEKTKGEQERTSVGMREKLECIEGISLAASTWEFNWFRPRSVQRE